MTPEDSLADMSLVDEDGERVPEPAWAGDALTTLIISGAAFGFGLFGLIFSLLPPKLRKLISWFGFSNSNRTVALKLLTVAASTGDDVHGWAVRFLPQPCLELTQPVAATLRRCRSSRTTRSSFSVSAGYTSLQKENLATTSLLVSGWQAEEAYLLRETTAVLSRVTAKFPDGTLWILNRMLSLCVLSKRFLTFLVGAKLFRMSNDVESAITTIETALAKGSTFREADSLLVFEVSSPFIPHACHTI